MVRYLSYNFGGASRIWREIQHFPRVGTLQPSFRETDAGAKFYMISSFVRKPLNKPKDLLGRLEIRSR
jgi:hypothetical protein